MPATLLYLMRHAATEANLARPPRLQVQGLDPPLAPLGVRQAQAARDFLADKPIQHCYCSPLQRAVQTAGLVAEPHGSVPQPIQALTECDVGRWEGLTWSEIATLDPQLYQQFISFPGEISHPEGESLPQVQERVCPVLAELLHRHAGETILVVAHHNVNRVYLASLLGLQLNQARQLSLANASFSLIERQGEQTTVRVLQEVSFLESLEKDFSLLP